jgi:hypothetical protein
MAGMFGAAIGFAVLGFGVVVAATLRGGSALPLGLAIGVSGLLFLLSGLGRMTARMEITGTRVVWTWSFSRHEVSIDDLVDAALVEKGSPVSGGSMAGLLGAGLTGVAALWLYDSLTAVARSAPTLGTVELVLIKRYGGPVEITPISAWSTPSAMAQANEALVAVQTAIDGSDRPKTRRLPILRNDNW